MHVNKALLSSEDIVGVPWTLHHDAPSRRIRLMPMADVPAFVNSLSGATGEVIFDEVANVLISTRESFVIGECKACEIRQTPRGMACAMSIDDFGSSVSIMFEFSTFRRP